MVEALHLARGGTTHPHRMVMTALASSAEPLARLYRKTALMNPSRRTGPLRFTNIAGKGRGVVVTRDVEPGDLLMVSLPIGCTLGTLGTCPSVEDLVKDMQAQQYTPAELAVLHALYPGRQPPTPPPQHSGDITPLLAALPRRKRSDATSRSKSTAGPDTSVAIGSLSAQGSTATDSSSVRSSIGTNTSSSNGSSSGQDNTTDPTNTSSSSKCSMSSRQPASSTHTSTMHTHTPALASASSISRRKQLRPLEMDAAHLQSVLRYNIFGTEAEDRAIAAVQGREVRSIIGLWPEFSLLNHSCCQNSVSYVTGDRMVVRAAQGIGEGGEVTKNYLGMDGMAPVGARRKALEEGYGFRCACPRCESESSLPSSTQAALQELHSEVSTKLSPLLSRCIAQGRDAEALVVLEQLRDMLSDLGSALQPLNLPDREEIWVRGGMYDLFDALWTGSVWMGIPDGDALGCKLEILEELAAGSDAHLYSALEWYMLVQREEWRDEEEVEEADDGVVGAHRVRYGRVGARVTERLVDVRWGDVEKWHEESGEVGEDDVEDEEDEENEEVAAALMALMTRK